MDPVVSPEAPSTSSNSAAPRKPRKVRSACERCRYRRIKCDGQVPACGNCAKADSLCVDVDGHDTEKRIVRGFSTTNAVARINWLETIIRTELPHINLDDGPQFLPVMLGDGVLPDQPNPGLTHFAGVSGSAEESLGSNALLHSGASSIPPRGQKRLYSNVNEPVDRETSVEEDTRSVALDLGLLSLNSESRQVHYLGSSSGSLFASLLQARKGAGLRTGASSRFRDPRHIFDRAEDPQLGPGDVDIQHLEEVRKAVQDLYAMLKSDLPPRTECNTLLHRFFQHMHPNHPFLHRPSFECIVDALYQCASASVDSPIQYNGWPSTVGSFDYNGEQYASQGQRLIPISAHVAAFQLFTALSIGATLQIRGRKYSHNPMLFFKSAISLAQHVFGTISLPVLQAILLLIVHSLIDPEGCNVWVLTHISMAHAVDLGLHREIGNSGKFGNVALQMRRRIFFCVYSLDRSISTIQGRPLGLGDDTFDVLLPTAIPATVDSNISNSSLATVDNATMSYSIQVFKMAQQISKIKYDFYLLPSDSTTRKSSYDLLLIQQYRREELSQWLEESTRAVTTASPPQQRLRLITKLKIQFHFAMCLLHQPSQAIVRPSDEALHICFESAAERIRLYETLYESGALCHSWRTVQDMFLAGATIMYCASISSNVRRSVSLSSLTRDFRSCSSMLSVGGEWWPMIRNARSSLERLASHTLEIFAEKVRSESDNTQLMQPTQTGTIDSVQPFNSSENFSSASIEDAFASVLNHDGQLASIFDNTPAIGFMDEMPIYNHDPYAYNEAFWSNFDETGFAEASRQSRHDGRDLQDFIDNLGT